MNEKDRLYKKELTLTIVFGVLYFVCAYFCYIFVLFPGLTGRVAVFGFPLEYLLPIIMGWFGLLIVCQISSKVLNRFDEEMEEYHSGAKTADQEAPPSGTNT